MHDVYTMYTGPRRHDMHDVYTMYTGPRRHDMHDVYTMTRLKLVSAENNIKNQFEPYV